MTRTMPTGCIERSALRRALIATALVGVGTLLPGCQGRDQAPAAAQPLPEVEVVELEARTITRVAELPGRVVAARIAEIRPQVSGIVLERLFEQGARVEAGQLLYRIDESPYRAAVDRARAERDRAQAAVDATALRERRFAALLQQRSVSQQDYDDLAALLRQQQAELAVAEAALRAAEVDLAFTRIKAPIDGVVGPALITIGALVTANQAEPLARVTALDPIFVDLRQPVGELARLRAASSGPKLAVELVRPDGSMYDRTGRLEVRDVAVDPATATVRLRAEFPNPDGLLLPGMYVHARVALGEQPDVVLAPQRGIQRNPRGEAEAIVVDAEGMTEVRRVVTGAAIGSDWVIEDGLAAGERIVVAGSQRIQPGQRVRPLPFRGAAADQDVGQQQRRPLPPAGNDPLAADGKRTEAEAGASEAAGDG